jgi:type IV secretory pathway TraG/TraD family ATPase VirD4
MPSTINAPGQMQTHDWPAFWGVGVLAFALFSTVLTLGVYHALALFVPIRPGPGEVFKVFYLQFGPDVWARGAGYASAAGLREWMQGHPLLLYAGYVVNGIAAAGAGWLGYLASRPAAGAGGETHIEGPRFWKEPGEAAKRAQGFETRLVKSTGGGVRIGGYKTKGGQWKGGVQISRDRETKHLYVIGKTGGGKTVAIKPLIQQAIERGDQLVIFDNKGEFTEWLYESNGREPVLLAPWDSRSWAWDIGRDCRTAAQAVELAARLIPDGDSDPMWNQGARQILAGLIKKLQSEQKDRWGWKDLSELLSVPTNQVADIMKTYHPEGLRAVEQAESGGKEGGKSTSKTTQSLLITMSTQLSPVYRMAEAWEGVTKRFSVRDFIDNKSAQVLVLQGSADYSQIAVSYIQGIIALIRSRINSPDFVERKASDPGIWIILDEFPQMGKLEKIQQFLEIGRSKGVRVVFGLQDNSQMFSIYGNEDGRVLMAQPQSFILAGVGDVDSIKWMQSKVGNRIVERHRRSASMQYGGGGSISAQSQRETEPVIREDEFNIGLGNTGSGVRVLWYPGQGDLYKLELPFPSVKKCRPAVVPARWTLPAWEQQSDQAPAAAVSAAGGAGGQAQQQQGEGQRGEDLAPALEAPQGDQGAPVVRVPRVVWTRLYPTREGAAEAEGDGGEVALQVGAAVLPGLSELLHAAELLGQLSEMGRQPRGRFIEVQEAEA